MTVARFPRAFASQPPVGDMRTTPDAVQAAKNNHGSQTVVADVMLRRSADSAAMLEYWDLTDAIVDGVNALRLAGEKYLPKFTDEASTEYAYRLKCTKLTNVYRDAVEGLASKPFESEVTFADETVPPALQEFAENVDGSGNNLTIFASATFFNGINSAIDWIFVDHPPANANIRSIADAKASGLRPYWSHVLGRNILDAQSKVINGTETLTYVRIFEPGSPDHVRIFERLDSGAVIWELREKRNDWIDYLTERTQFHPIGNGVVTIGAIPLVPFVTGRRDGRTWKLFPAMRDAADLQIELYQDESALKFAKRLTGYPMLAANGIKPPVDASGQPRKVAVGPSRVLYGGVDGAGNAGSWAYVEPGAQSLTFLAKDIADTIGQLRELARQPLIVGNVTVISAGRAAGKSKSAVKAWALGLKDALENAMLLTAKWLGVNYEPTISVFTEFDEFTEGKDLETLDADRERKDISQETLWEEKKRRGVYGPEFTAERERERLLAELPADGDDRSLDDNPPVLEE